MTRTIEILEVFKESFALIRDLDLAFRWVGVGACRRPIPPVMTTPMGVPASRSSPVSTSATHPYKVSHVKSLRRRHQVLPYIVMWAVGSARGSCEHWKANAEYSSGRATLSSVNKA